MEYILSQIIGIFVCLFTVASMQLKNIKTVLLCMLISNGLATLSYVLLGEVSAFAICLIGTTQSLIFYLLRKYEKEEPRWIYPIVFSAYIACSALTFKQPLDIMPAAAALFGGLAVVQKASSAYRIVILFNAVTWVIYDIYVGAYTMLITHSLATISALSGIVRIDILKK